MRVTLLCGEWPTLAEARDLSKVDRIAGARFGWRGRAWGPEDHLAGLLASRVRGAHSAFMRAKSTSMTTARPPNSAASQSTS
jgi:hypothetical protein